MSHRRLVIEALTDEGKDNNFHEDAVLVPPEAQPTLDLPQTPDLFDAYRQSRYGTESFDSRSLVVDHDGPKMIGPEDMNVELQGHEDDLGQLSTLVEGFFGLSYSLESDPTAVTPRMLRTLDALAASVGGPTISSENFGNERQVSLEGIGQTIKNIWEAIVRLFKKIWDRITGFFKAIKVHNSFLIARLDRLEATIEGKEGSLPRVTVVEVGESYHHLGRGAVDALGPKEVLAGLSNYIQLTKSVMHEYVAHVHNVGSQLVRAAGSAKPEMPGEEWVKEMNKAGAHFVTDQLYQILGTTKEVVHPKFAGMVVKQTNTLIGGRVIWVVSSHVDHEASLDDQTTALTSSEVILGKSGQHRNVGKGTTMHVMDIDELRDLVHATKKLLDVAYPTHEASPEVALLKISEHLKEICDKSKNELVGSVTEVARALQYVTALSRWSAHPIIEVAASSQQIATQMLAMLNRHVQAYK